jgi:hypothetical protein
LGSKLTRPRIDPVTASSLARYSTVGVSRIARLVSERVVHGLFRPSNNTKSHPLHRFESIPIISHAEHSLISVFWAPTTERK